jgi:peptidoglycan/LPS O-acetylase OafA/YrhL
MVTSAAPAGVASASSGASSRIEQADGLRAVACMLVIWQHVSEVYKDVASGGLWLSRIADQIDFGRIGVTAFFALSGFVVPHSIRGPRLQAVADFAERRFWRLYPAYWFSIPLGLLAVWVIWKKDPTLAMLCANWTMLPSLWGQPFAMGHYWTLEVELAFYVCCALLYLIFGRINLLLGLCCLVCACVAQQYKLLAGTPHHWPFATLDLMVMFWGCCCRFAYDGVVSSRFARYGRALTVALIVASAALVLWEPLEYLWRGYVRDILGHQRLGWGYSIGVLLFAIWVLALRVRSRPLEWIGQGTYSIYLLHPVVFYVAFKLVRSRDWPALDGLHLGVYLALLMPACLAAGMLGHRFVERPSDRLRRLLERVD